MKKRRLGTTILSLSELALGGASIGNLFQASTAAAAEETIAASWAGGIRYFDTAPEYGHGLSERRFGDALRHHVREDYILSTKVGEVLFAQHNKLPAENKFIDKLPFHLRYDYSYAGIMRAFEDSLQRLGTNRIDILLVHDLDSIIHGEKLFEHHFNIFAKEGYLALQKLREEGVVQAIGLGVKEWQVCQRAMKTGHYDCFMLQGNYTLLDQDASSSGFMSQCLKENISILIAGPYASGILVTGPVPGAYYHHRPATNEVLARVTQIEKTCQKYAVPLPAVALQFPLTHPAVTSVVVGGASASAMRENLRWFSTAIPSELWNDLSHDH